MTPDGGFQAQTADEAARRRIQTSLDESLIVEASAGTGKTSELVRRIVAVIASGRAAVDGIVAVTFTHKAAGELKLRLRKALDEARATAEPTEASHLERALQHLEEASIGTIHSFCAQILRERPVEAVVDPAFEELSEPEAARIFERAFRVWMQARLSETSPGLRRALVRLAWRDSWDTAPPLDQLQYCGRKLIEWRDFPSEWQRPEFPREQLIDMLVDQAKRLADMVARCARLRDNLVKSLTPLREFVTRVERAVVAGGTPDYDTIEGLLLKLRRDIGRNFRKGSGFFAEGAPRETVINLKDQLSSQIEQFRELADADLAALLRSEMWELVTLYDDLKRRGGKLDFVDLLLLVRNLVRDNREVRSYLQRRFTHIFVDEFQDTDPLQAEVLLLLSAADPAQSDWLEVTPVAGKLFLVGDPKQSIYKFRRADVVLYREICNRLVERGAGHVKLTRSYRSQRPIQDCVNAAFAPAMTGDVVAGQADYSPLEPHWPEVEGQPAVIALPMPSPYGMRGVTKTAVNACLPDTIVGFVEWLLSEECRWTVRDLEDDTRRVPIRSHHIAILFRRFVNFQEDLTRDYVRSLESRNIPHLLVGSKSFHRREEVETLRAALTAIEWPEDELSVFAALKGSLFAIGDSALLRFKCEQGRLHPFRPLPGSLPDEFEPIREALGLLKELHYGRNRRPVAETVNSLLEATRAHAGFVLRPAGHQVLANIYRIGDLARTFESSGGISFRAFVEELAAQSEKGESAEAPVLEEGAEGVRLMTVHNAKGLEFPIVILADMTAKLAAGDPDRYVDGQQRLCAMRLLRCAPLELTAHDAVERAREQAEGVRVSYVAATRARDLLVAPVIGDEEMDGWAGPLNRALYPSRDNWRKSSPAPGCPAFGHASVLSRPLELGHEEISVKPGLHAPREGSHSVVWWDPAKLRLRVETKFGLGREDILAGDSDAPLRSYEAWKLARRQTIERGLRPEFDIFTASEASSAPPGFTGTIAIESVEKILDRPAGRRFGTLVHGILRDCPLNAGREQIEAIGQVQSRLTGAPEEEMKAAVEAVLAALAHPLLQRARSATPLRREWPLIWRTEDGRILEGVIDLAFLENGAWIVVDFKTGEYGERQIQWYVEALSKIEGAPARGYLLNL